jgi:GTP-binding protein
MRFVDLPGYGFARVSKEKRSQWEAMITGFLLEREQLACVFQLIDASIPVQQKDLDFSNWMGEHQIPFALVFTKTDKKEKTAEDTPAAYQGQMLESWESLPPVFTTSAHKQQGRDAILAYIEEILRTMPSP